MLSNPINNGDCIAVLPLKLRIDNHRTNLHNPNTIIKRKKRINAIEKEKLFNLDEKKMRARLELAEKAIEIRDINNVIAATNKLDNKIYCCKTGIIIGEINIQSMAFIAQLKMPFNDNGLTDWQTQHAIHPAWLNTSATVLSQLQRIMPHEYCVYVYTYLIERHAESLHKTIKQTADINISDDLYKRKETKTTIISSIPAPIKHNLLNNLYKAPLYIIIEIAELLRIFAALMGKNKAFVNAMPDIFNFMKPETFRIELLEYLRKALIKNQKKHHAKDLDRQRLITMADLHHITTNDGMRLFHEAKISLNDDNPILADVADLFREAGLTSTMVAKDYSQIKPLFNVKPNKPEYSAKVIDSEVNETNKKLKPITL